MTQEEWHAIGYRNGWCGPILCLTHDGEPTTPTEDSIFNDGDDPCVPMIRMYSDIETKLAVEANHSPSVWRASNSGL